MKLDRMLGIVFVLMQKDKVAAPDLARRFEVSRRTISRDIDALCRAGIPIVTQQGAGGGVSIAEGFRIEKGVLTADELSDLLAAIKGVGTVTAGGHAQGLVDKLRIAADSVISLREPVVIDLASHYKGPLTEKIEGLKRAILDRQYVGFDYRYEKGLSHRCIEPHLLLFQWSAWYVLGFCTHRQDFRLFKLARLSNLLVHAETFPMRAIPEEQISPHARFPDDSTARVAFHPDALYRVLEEYGDCTVEVLPGGWSVCAIGYTFEDNLLSWLLQFGADARVLHPPALAGRVANAARRMLALYE